MAPQASPSDITNALAKLSTKDSPTTTAFSNKVLSEREVSAEGIIVDSHGDAIGQIVQGDATKCASQKLNGNGQVVNSKGKTIGKASMASDSDATLRARVQGLAPELFDTIQDMVFTPSTDAANIEKGSTKAPYQLQVSRATRELFAQRWYSDKAFFVKSAMDGDDTCRLWLSSLPPEHRKLINHVYLDGLKLRAGLDDGSLQRLEVEGLAALLAMSPMRWEHRDRFEGMISTVRQARFDDDVLNADGNLGVKPEAFKMWVYCANGRVIWSSTWREVFEALIEGLRGCSSTD